MPLKRGYSRDTISENISRCMHEGTRSQEQCIAIAHNLARDAAPKSKRAALAVRHIHRRTSSRRR